MSLAQLADAGGLSKGHLSSVEHGLAAITVETLDRIARALEALPMDLVTFPEEEDRGRIADIVRRLPKKDLPKLRREMLARAPAEAQAPTRRRTTSAPSKRA
jgi:transcriptional regulator with XRE-family HTH domain